MLSKKNDSQKTKTRLRIVVIGGGHGVAMVLEGLCDYPVDLSAIISMADDGGSSGVLRRELGLLPPGDVRRALGALADNNHQAFAKLWDYRFTEGSMAGHNVGNLILAALARIHGSFAKGLDRAHKILGARGRVIPVTLELAELCAEYADGSVVRGERHIDLPDRNAALAIRRVWLDPTATPHPAALRAIRAADAIVIGPGDLYTSILPNLLVHGIAEAIRSSHAKKIMVVNYRTKGCETNSFSVTDFIRELERYLGEGVLDVALCNTTPLSKDQRENIVNEGGELVVCGNKRVISRVQLIRRPLLATRGALRHDPKKLARAIMALMGKKEKNGNRRT